MVRERKLRSLDLFGKLWKECASDSTRARKRELEGQLEKPPLDFDERQALLDRVPDHMIRSCDDLFVTLLGYCQDVLKINLERQDLGRAAKILIEAKQVPVLSSKTRGHTRKGEKVFYTVFRVLRWDYERGLERNAQANSSSN